MRPLLIALGALLCLSAECGPARADQVDRVLRAGCGHRGEAIADLVRFEARRHLVHPAVLAAVVAVESTCRPWAVGRLGEIGLGQILPGGSAARGYSAEQLRDPSINLHLTAAHLARLETMCGCLAGALSVFSGRKRCRPSGHSRLILAIAERGSP